MKEKISIIVTVYNIKKYLTKCIESALKQDYTNLEIILVDDGSNDGSEKLCDEFAKKDKRIIAVHQKNGGVASARNKGMKIATGNWLVFVDGDDAMSHQMVKILYESVTSETDIVSCAYFAVDNGKCKKYSFLKKNECIFQNSFEDKKSLYLQLTDKDYVSVDGLTAIGVPWGKLYRRSFLNQYHLHFDVKLRRMQDNIFNMNAFYYAKMIKYIDVPLYYYTLDHISRYHYKYAKDADVNYSLIIKNRYGFFSKNGYFEDLDIQNVFISELLSMIHIISISKMFHVENHQNLFEKFREFYLLIKFISRSYILPRKYTISNKTRVLKYKLLRYFPYVYLVLLYIASKRHLS